MRPEPTQEQQELKDTVARFTAERVTRERLEAWQLEPRGIDEASWRAIAELGWFGVGIPEVHGGSGLGLVEVACLLEEAAGGLIPRAVIGGVRGGWALARLGPDAAQLKEITRGEASVALAIDEEGGRDAACFETRIEGDAANPRLRGKKAFVANAEHSEYQIVAARDGDGISLVLVRGDQTEIHPVRTFDGERQATVAFDGIPFLCRLGDNTALTILRREQAALALAEMVGGMRAVLDMTAAYVKEREQFGQKIAVFQAVQHQVADMAMSLTAGRHLAWQAITRLSAGTEEGRELDVAAAFVGRAFKQITYAGHHLHGGAGYVVEHPLHYHAERAQALCIRYTPEAAALAGVAANLLD